MKKEIQINRVYITTVQRIFKRSAIIFLMSCFALFIVSACKTKQEDHSHHQEKKEQYTCPMHPEVISNAPGKCPVCGMDLVKKETDEKNDKEIGLGSMVKPTNEFVTSTIPVLAMQSRTEQIEIEVLGKIAYDTRTVGSISARVTGRIDKLYVRYRYQRITKGEHILDIYSPELLTAQQNLLFLLKNDSQNASMIDAAKQRLIFLGMSNKQIEDVIQSGQPQLTIAVFSNYNGHIHEAAGNLGMNTGKESMKDVSLITEELSLKEGMYVKKGESIFKVFNPDYATAVLNVYGESQSILKTGNRVRMIAETAPSKQLEGRIDFIEPFYRKENKTLAIRVYFNNSALKIPIGSQVRATIFGDAKDAYWLPEEAVLSLGIGKVVFLKEEGGFRTRRINTGIIHEKHVQVLSGLSGRDSVAANAQYLMDSETFIKVKE